MPSFFHGLNLASRALQTFQRAIDVTGHNISNVNTRGYSRQQVDISTSDPLAYYQNGPRTLGNGAGISSISRTRAGFLDSQMRSAASDMGKNDTVATGLEGILTTYNEPNEGSVSKALGGFFNAWSALASNPNETANRTSVKLAGQKLGSTIRGMYKELKIQSDNSAIAVKDTVAQVNSISGSLATLNNQIRQASVNGAEPSDLLDRRDNLLEQLSGLVNVTTQNQADGTVNVFMSEATLVDGATSTDLPSGINAAGQLTDGTHTYTVRSGQLAGHLSNTTQIKTQLAQLDTLANTIRTQVNAIHTTGLNANGTTAINFFNDALPGDPQTGAIDFDLSVEVASDTKNIAIGVTAAAGDNGLALQISGLRSVSVASLGNKSMLDYHKDNVAAVGSNHAYFMNAADTQGAIAEQIDNQRQAVSGVSIDDEMSNMLKYQKSYQAAAKMVGVFDQMAQDIIGMIR